MNDITAFPSHGAMGEVVQDGMSLRQWYAGQAMVFVARAAEMEHVGPQELAAACFEYADAMLLESTMPGPVRDNYELQLSNANARGDRMRDALRVLVDALLPTDSQEGPARAALVKALALLDDDENVPF